MTTTMKKTIPIQVTAENGEKVTYTLTIYKEDSLTELETVTVDGKEATKISDTSYKAIIPAELVSSTIEAKTLYTKAKAEINKLGEEVHITKQVIATIGNETIVKIYVRFGEGENEREKRIHTNIRQRRNRRYTRIIISNSKWTRNKTNRKHI